MPQGFRCLLAILACAICFAACASPERRTEWSRHWDLDAWTGSLERQWERPDRLAPEGFLAATVPVAFVFDHDIQRHEENVSVSSTTKNTADALQFVLAGIAVGISGYKWTHGDDGH